MAYDRPNSIIAGVVVLQLLATSAVILRVVSRRRTGKKLLGADWLIELAFILGIGLSGLMIWGCTTDALGVPSHIWWDYMDGNTIFYVSFILGIVATGLIKISASLFCLSVYDTPVLRRIIYSWVTILGLSTVAFAISFFIEEGIVLGPLDFSASLPLKPTMCGSAACAGWAYVITNAITGFLTLILVVSMACVVRIPARRQVAAGTAFIVGAISVGASFGKAYPYTHFDGGRVDVWGSLAFGGSAPTVTAAVVWNLVEVQIGILAASLLTLTPLLRRKTRHLAENEVQREPQVVTSARLSEPPSSIIFSDPPPYEDHREHDSNVGPENEKTEDFEVSSTKNPSSHPAFRFQVSDVDADHEYFELPETSRSGSRNKLSKSRQSWV